MRNISLTGMGVKVPMAYEPGAIEAALAAVVGDDPELAEELRRSLIESAERYADLLSRARCDANWYAAAWRLKGVAASFGATILLKAADDAIDAAPGDPVTLRKVSRAINSLKG
jgi:HPt (histidine-containing phosphotransfer) domain-containing protein